MQNIKHTLKSTPLATHNKTIFFKCPTARRTICSSLETSNEIISIKALQFIKFSHAKGIKIYEVGSTDCLMDWTKTKKISYSRIINFFQQFS